MALLALGLMFVVVVLVVAASVWAGAEAYVGWRREERANLNKRESKTGWQYGPYESPFPWHWRKL